MGIAEVIFGVGFVGLMIGCWFLMKGIGRIFWMTTFGLILAVVIGAEIVGTVTQHHTISQMFWQFSVDNPGKAWAIIGMLAAAFGLLLWHLATKMLNRGK